MPASRCAPAELYQKHQAMRQRLEEMHLKLATESSAEAGKDGKDGK